MEQGPEELENADDRAEALQDLTDKPLDQKGAGAKPSEKSEDDEHSDSGPGD